METEESGLKRARVGASYLALLLSTSVLVTTLALGMRVFLGPAIGICLGAVLGFFLTARGNTRRSDLTSEAKAIDWRLPLIVLSIYVAGILVSYRAAPLGIRPTLHYVLFGGVVSFIGYQIHRGQSRTSVLLQLAAVGFFTYWSSQLAFPAGVRASDTPEILHGIKQSHTYGYVIPGVPYSHTPVQLIIIIQGVEVTGLSFALLYALLATAMLTATLLLIGVFLEIFPSISRKTALYATLFFAFMSFTLNRGFIPHKTNFFRPLIVVVLVAVVYMVFIERTKSRWLILGIVSFAALGTGHGYSAGAVFILVSVFLVYWVVTRFSPVSSYERIPKTFPLAISLSVIVAFLGYSLFTTGTILKRITRIFSSILFISGSVFGGTTGGRYADIDLSIILFATALEAFVFIFGVAGIIIAIRKARWDLDMIVFWIVVGSGMIGIGLLLNPLDIPVQRIYVLLGLFGLNVMMALSLQSLLDARSWGNDWHVIVVILLVFSILALSSPVAMTSLSPVSDELPHDRKYETDSNQHSVEWMESYARTEGLVLVQEGIYTRERDLLTMTVPHHELPLMMTENGTVMTNRDRIRPGQTYMYNSLGERTGVLVPAEIDERILGGRDFRFLEPNPKASADDKIYTNDEVEFFNRTAIELE